MNISIITPSYNQASYIKRTLESVAQQRKHLPPGVQIEHIVFDGNSTDGTQDILQAFEPAVTWVSEKDGGQTDAVNKGLKLSSGEIIGWLNSDDIYYPATISKVLDFFAQHPDVDIVYGQADHIDTNDQPFERYPTEPWNFERLKEVCFICQPALFFRRRVLAQCGLLNDILHYCMDYDYWLRLSLAGLKFAYLEEPLAGSRLYPDNKTLGSRVAVHAEINDMFKSHFGHVPDRWLFNYAHAVLEQQLCRKKRPYWFVIRLLMTSVAASWRWNQAISPVFKSPLVDWRRALGLRGHKEVTGA